MNGNRDCAHDDVPAANEDGAGRSGGADDLARVLQRVSALQSQIVKLSRFTVVERMTLGLAHELNQPLAAIANYLRAGQKLIADTPHPDLDRLAIALDGAARQSHHAGALVSRLRGFVAGGEAERRPEPLVPLIEEAIALARPEIDKSDVRLAVALEPSAAVKVQVDRVQIHQILLNLIRNAVEAMRSGPSRDLWIATRSVDDTVEITVTDSGPGLAREISDRLFEPFATTRDDGVGLGLMISRAIAEAHGGTLSCQPAPNGSGCAFRLTVPVA